MTLSYASYDAVLDGDSDIMLNRPRAMREVMRDYHNDTLYAFTLHEIFYEADGGKPFFKQTRSSPNWQGGVCTMSTCKQQMRTWNSPQEWIGKWNAMFTPSHCANNALFFVGQVWKAFESNYDYGYWLETYDAALHAWKQADDDPRGDVYRPQEVLMGSERYHVDNFHEPPGHTRSTETYKDGTPKWWKDIRYKLNGKYPPTLMYYPAFLFSVPMRWTDLTLGRAVRKVTVGDFVASLQKDAP